MKNHLFKLALLVTLGSGIVLAQGYPQQPSSQQPASNPAAQNPGALPQTQQSSTTNVQSDIQSALQKDQTLASANISVQVSDKAVELSGTAPTKEAKDAAEQIARSHAGGLDVKNNIKVEGKGADNPK